MPSNTHADTSWIAKLPLEGADGCPLCMSNHTLRYGLGGQHCATLPSLNHEPCGMC